MLTGEENKWVNSGFTVNCIRFLWYGAKGTDSGFGKGEKVKGKNGNELKIYICLSI